MGHTLRYRLFGIGRLPADLRAAVEAEGALLLAEGIPVLLRRDGTLPGILRSRSVRSLSGALAVTPARVVGTAGRMKLVDAPTAGGADGGAATLTLSGDGLRVEIDLARATGMGAGTIALHFRWPIAAEALVGLPRTRWTTDAPAERAERLFRWGGV